MGAASTSSGCGMISDDPFGSTLAYHQDLHEEWITCKGFYKSELGFSVSLLGSSRMAEVQEASTSHQL